MDIENNAFLSELEDLNNDQIRNRIRIFEDNVRIMRNQENQIREETEDVNKIIKETEKKIEDYKQLPYLISNVNEILEVEKDDPEESDLAVVVKTTNRQTIYLPIAGLINPRDLRPNDIVGVNKDSFLILDILPREFDTRIKAMELEERPDV